VYLEPVCLEGQTRGLARAARDSIQETIPLEGGYRFEFDPDEATLLLIARMIDAERQRGRFLRFDLSVPADGRRMSLDVTGPTGA
jgi:hypothetical protein